MGPSRGFSIETSLQTNCTNRLVLILPATGAVGVLVVFWLLTLRQSADLQRADVLSGRVRPDEPFVAGPDRKLQRAELGVAAEFIRAAAILGATFGLISWQAY